MSGGGAESGTATIKVMVGEAHSGNDQRYKIVYVPLDPVTDYVYIADLNTRLHVG